MKSGRIHQEGIDLSKETTERETRVIIKSVLTTPDSSLSTIQRSPSGTPVITRTTDRPLTEPHEVHYTKYPLSVYTKGHVCSNSGLV